MDDPKQIDMGLVAVPTPEPFDPANPTKQRENWYYCLNQILSQAHEQGFRLPEPTDVLIALQDLQFQGVILDGHGIRILMTRKNTVIGG